MNKKTEQETEESKGALTFDFQDAFNREMEAIKNNRGFDDFIKSMSVAIHNAFMADFMHAVKVGYLGNHWMSGGSDVKVLETRQGSAASAFDLMLLDDENSTRLNIEFKTRLKNDRTYNDIMRSVEDDLLKITSDKKQTKLEAMFEKSDDFQSAGLILILMYERSMRDQMPFMDFESCECIMIIGGNLSKQIVMTKYGHMKNTLVDPDKNNLASWFNSLINSECGDWLGDYQVGMDVEEAIEKDREISRCKAETIQMKNKLNKALEEIEKLKKQLVILKNIKGEQVMKNALETVLMARGYTSMLSMTDKAIALLKKEKNRDFELMEMGPYIYSHLAPRVIEAIHGQCKNSEKILTFIEGLYGDAYVSFDDLSKDLFEHNFYKKKPTETKIVNDIMSMMACKLCHIQMCCDPNSDDPKYYRLLSAQSDLYLKASVRE